MQFGFLWGIIVEPLDFGIESKQNPASGIGGIMAEITYYAGSLIPGPPLHEIKLITTRTEISSIYTSLGAKSPGIVW
jgi:hypothetical protein